MFLGVRGRGKFNCLNKMTIKRRIRKSSFTWKKLRSGIQHLAFGIYLDSHQVNPVHLCLPRGVCTQAEARPPFALRGLTGKASQHPLATLTFAVM